MPARPSPLWLLTGLLLAAFPILNFVYWPKVLESGTLPPDADSIGIPMFGSVLLTLAASPAVLGVAWLCLRRYNPRARLTALRWDRPYRSILATLIFGGLATLLSVEALTEATASSPWYEYLWPAYSMLWVSWLLTLRAALIEQHSAAELEAEDLIGG